MSYATLDKKNWPLGWEELEHLVKELRLHTTEYYVIAERSVFGSERYRYHICKHEMRGVRHVIGTYTYMAEMTPILRLLISTAKDEYAARQLALGEMLSNKYGEYKF